MRAVVTLVLCISALQLYSQADYVPLQTTIPVISAYSSRYSNPFQADVNQATLAFITNPAVAVYNERKFLLKELSGFKAAAVYPHKSGGYGASISYSGNPFYNETRFALGLGRKLSSVVAIGIQFSYLLNRVHAQLKSGAFSSEAGMVFKLSEHIQAGFQLRNLLRSPFKHYGDQLPVTYGFGFGYDVSEKLFITALVEKQAGIQSNLIVAMRYLFIPAFYIQTGINGRLHQLFLGLGFEWSNKRIEFTTGYHDQLGVTPGLSLIWPFGKPEE